MSDIERYDADPYAGTVAVPARYSLTDWGDEFLATARISSELARTHFVPQSLWVWRKRDGADVFDQQATTMQVTAVIVTGQELGLGPMAALRSVDVINGTPALRAVALRAILLRHGHDMWVEESSNSRCVVAGQRNGSPHVQRVTWTIEDARARNLAGKPNWRTQPRNMLIARATGDCARLVAADAIMGIPYTAEELEDGVTGTSTAGAGQDAPAAPGRRTRRPAQIVSKPSDQPVADDNPPTDESEGRQQDGQDSEGAQPVVSVAQTPGSGSERTGRGVAGQPDPGGTGTSRANRGGVSTDDGGSSVGTDEPGLDDIPPPEDPPPAITAGQTRRLHALIRQAFGDYRKEATVREAVLTDISESIGRPIESTSALTAAEASVIIARWDATRTDQEQPPEPPEDQP